MSVTAPPPPAQTPQQQTHALLSAIVLILAANAAADVVETTIAALLAPVGITARAVGQALALLGPVGPLPSGRAGAFTAASEYVYRAQYILSAAIRLTGGESESDEARFADQHLAAQKARAGAAAMVDATVASTGSPRLEWRARKHGPPTDGCQLADGTVFTVDDPPVVDGRKCFPGQTHPYCQCTAVPAP